MAAQLNSKILVVDDEKHILELARLYLSREGYEVEGLGDGAQAVTRFGCVDDTQRPAVESPQHFLYLSSARAPV